MNTPPVLARMEQLISAWSAAEDRRDAFLRCYRMMTVNMHTAIARGEFADGAWVELLLRRFADYYFEALAQWDADTDTAPRVWQRAHACTRDPEAMVWQQLILGVNAHINYDLVLTVHELLDAEWGTMSGEVRRRRVDDYCRVNAIIAATIDAVQDDVLAPAMPVSAILDRLLGRVDEYMISRLITSWRDQTWSDAVRLLENPDPAHRQEIIAGVEERAMRLASLIGPGTQRDLQDTEI